ncbi:MAG: hypothetical protein C7B47_09445 [Sulfobacillus thermosulfidooxidans]|uniref:Uncharacterized protein n=1 Tax=Sulfobacillus thermosulfidooxidans TaxID=28034 RepID=A0A2T2WXJ4_SULTH|nr:MAG: hypothetical protein C7B47_09445 [Sulfobacillus thermosulfidooxidans]
MVISVSAKWWKATFWGMLLLGITGCGTFSGSSVSSSSGLVMAMPKQYPAVTGFSFSAVSPELEGAVSALQLNNQNHLAAVISWTNVPHSASFLLWQPGANHPPIIPYFHVSATALSPSSQIIVGGESNGKNVITFGQHQWAWSASTTRAPQWITASWNQGIYAVAPSTKGGWDIIKISSQKLVSESPLPLNAGQHIVAIAAAQNGGLWIATSHPNQIVLWRQGTFQQSYTLPGRVMTLVRPQNTRSLKSANPVIALLASPSALPGTADSVVEIASHHLRVDKLAMAWLVGTQQVPFIAGASSADWVSPHHLLLTLWDSGLNQVAIARLNLETGQATILPNSIFHPNLLNAQAPFFPLTASPSKNLIVVGQGYGLAFYITSSATWTQFMK